MITNPVITLRDFQISLEYTDSDSEDDEYQIARRERLARREKLRREKVERERKQTEEEKNQNSSDEDAKKEPQKCVTGLLFL